MADPAQFQPEIELLLNQIAKDPTDFALYKQLRNAAFAHKAAGGRDLGMFAKFQLKLGAADPLQRLLDALRLWSFEPGNSDHAVGVLQSLENYSCQFPNADIVPIRRWLSEILMRMNGEGRR